MTLAIASGCNTSSQTPPVDPLIGKWICKDMSHTGHTADVDAYIVHFKPTGEFESFYVHNEGGMARAERENEAPRWRVAGGALHIGDAPAIDYRVVGDVLRMTITDAYHDQLTLVFTRQP